MQLHHRVTILCIGLFCVISNASSQTCQTEGPNLDSTHQYIINAMTSAGTHNFHIQYSPNTAEVLVWPGKRDEPSPNDHILYETASITALNCGSYGAKATISGFFVFVNCTGNLNCVRVQEGGTDTNVVGLEYHGDADHANRLAVALSHYLYLVQQDWKKAHDDPNDPFKPH